MDDKSETEITSTSSMNGKLILALVFVILGISQVIAVVASTVMTKFSVVPAGLPEGSIISLLATMIRNTLGIVIILFLIHKSLVPEVKPVSKEGYGLVDKKGRWTVKWYILLSAVLYGVIILLSLIVQAIRPSTDTSSVYDQFLTGLILQITFFLVAVIFAPIFEELLFRRVLMGSLQKAGFNSSYFIGFSALVFGFSHTLGDLTGGSIYTATLHLLTTTTIGIVLGIVYLKTQNIIYPILFHALNNALSSGLALLGLFAQVMPLLVGIIFVLIILVLAIVFIYDIYKLIKHRQTILTRVKQYIRDLHLFDTSGKRLLLAGTVCGFTFLPLAVIFVSSLVGASTQVTLAIYWMIIAIVSILVYTTHDGTPQQQSQDLY